MRVHAQQRKYDAAIDDLDQAWKVSPGNVGLLLLPRKYIANGR